SHKYSRNGTTHWRKNRTSSSRASSSSTTTSRDSDPEASMSSEDSPDWQSYTGRLCEQKPDRYKVASHNSRTRVAAEGSKGSARSGTRHRLTPQLQLQAPRQQAWPIANSHPRSLPDRLHSLERTNCRKQQLR